MANAKGKILQILSLGVLTAGAVGGVAACGTTSSGSSATSVSNIGLTRFVQSLSAADFENAAEITFNKQARVDNDTNESLDESSFYTAISNMSSFISLSTDLKSKFLLSDLLVTKDIENGTIKLTIRNHSTSRYPKVITFGDFLTPTDVTNLETALTDLTPEAFSQIQFKTEELPTSPDNQKITENLVLGILKTYLNNYGGTTNEISEVLVNSITTDNIEIIRDDDKGTIQIGIINLPNKIPESTVEISDFLDTQTNDLQILLTDIASTPNKISTLSQNLGLDISVNNIASDQSFTEQDFANALKVINTSLETNNKFNEDLVTNINFDDGLGKITVTMKVRELEISFEFTGYKQSEEEEKLTKAISGLTANNFVTPDLYSTDDTSDSTANLNVTGERILDEIKKLPNFLPTNIDQNVLDKFVANDVDINNLPYEGKINLVFRNHGPLFTVSITGFQIKPDINSLENALKMDEAVLRQIMGWDLLSTFPSENPYTDNSESSNIAIVDEIKAKIPAFNSFSSETKNQFNQEWITVAFDDYQGTLKLTIKNPETSNEVAVYDFQFQARIDLDDYLDPNNWSISTSDVSHLKTRQFIKNDPKVGNEDNTRSIYTTNEGNTFVMDQGGLYLFDPDNPDNTGNSLINIEKGNGFSGIVYEIDWHKLTKINNGPQYRTFVFWASTNTVQEIQKSNTSSTGFTVKDSEWDLNGAGFSDSFVYQIESGNVYIGSENKGLLQIVNAANKPELAQVSNNSNDDSRKPLPQSFMYEVKENNSDATTIYYGGYAGSLATSLLYIFNPITGTTERAVTADGGGDISQIKQSRMTQTSTGEVFLTRWAGGLLHRTENGTFEVVYNKGETKARDTGAGFITFLDGKLLISSWQADDYGTAAVQGLWEIIKDPVSDKWVLESYDSSLFLETFGTVADEIPGGRVYFIAQQGIFRIFKELPLNTKYQYAVNNESYSDIKPTGLKTGDIVHIRVVPESDSYKINYLYPELQEITITVQ